MDAQVPECIGVGVHVLPCGALGFLDGCGMRCLACFAIYGSIGCGCTNQRQRGIDKAEGKGE